MKNFHVYRSSAGSGKTYTLVKEYLKLALDKNSDAFKHILAITFTNKAANEMRERILLNLTEIADPDSHPESNAVKIMLPQLEAETGLERSLIVHYAGRVLTNILHNYQDFAVSTIDSFIHRIVRTFAFDLHLPLNFEVEVQADTLVAQAVDLLLSRVGVDDGPTKALAGFTESRIYDEKGWNIERDLKKFAGRLLYDDIVKFLPALQKMDSEEILKVSGKLNNKCRKFENDLSGKAGELMSFWSDQGIDPTDLAYGTRGLYSYVNKLSVRNFDGLNSDSRVKDALEDDKWYSKSLANERKVLVDSHMDEMGGMLGEIHTYAEENKEEYTFYSILKKNIYQLAVLNEILLVVDQIRENDGVIHISEFDKRIASVVNNEPIPFIYERLGEKYQHFLIDEFQDTSVLEWQNILPLIENALAQQQFNMVVGDGKQAIYRFKGGEVEQLDSLPKIFEKPDTPEMHMREASLERNFDPKTLEFNFRSHEEIINFNNAFYRFCSGLLPDGLKKIYADCEQKILKRKPGGEVQINFIDNDGVKAEKEPIYFNKILQLVKDLQENKAYDYRDIAILCRSNNEASKIARTLLTHGIDVVSAESLLLSSSPEVNFLLHCLDFLANSKDKIALAGILSYLAGKQDAEPLSRLLQDISPGRGEDDQSLERILGKHGMNFNPGELLQMGLYERVEAILRSFRLHETVDPYVIFFLDVVHDFSMNKRFVPEDFMEFWRENRHRFSIVVPAAMDAVKVMTIHKAKGLEFPVVIYPFANGKAEIKNEQKWVEIRDKELPDLKTALLPITKSLKDTCFKHVYDRELEMQQLDLLNILYVATTRPTERLILMCDKPKEAAEEIKNIPGLLRAYLEDNELWDETKLDYVIGDPGPIPAVAKKQVRAIHPQEFISGNWREKIILSGHAADYWDLDDDARNLEWGNLVHQVMGDVDTISDLEPSIQTEINKGNVSESKGAELLDILSRIISNEEVKEFFDGHYKLKNECGIMTSSGDEYRPDRLMIMEGRTVVLDYKTGKEEGKHLRQIERYAALLEEIGYKNIEKYLLYIGEDYFLKKA